MERSLNEIIRLVSNAIRALVAEYAAESVLPVAYFWAYQVFNSHVVILFEDFDYSWHAYQASWATSADDEIEVAPIDQWETLSINDVWNIRQQSNLAVNRDAVSSRRTRMTVNLNTAAAREEERNGRPHIVVPAITAQGVMNRVLYLPEELDAAIVTCNGRAVTVGHPQLNGEYVASALPEIDTYGTFLSGFIQDAALAGDLWIDYEFLLQHESGQLIVDAINNEDPINVSWGFYIDIEPVRGSFNGDEFDYIARNIRGEHVAILPNEVGACSVDDGCGTSLVSNESDAQAEAGSETLRAARNAMTLLSSDEQQPARLTQFLRSLISNNSQEANDMAILRRGNGQEPQNNVNGEDEITLDQIKEIVTGAVESATAPLATQIDELRANQQQQADQAEAELQRERDDLIDALANNEQCQLSRDVLEASSTDMLRELNTQFAPINMEGAAPVRRGAPQFNSSTVVEKPMPQRQAALNGQS